MKKITNLSRKTILVLGAGHIGEACIFKFIEHGAKKIILHTLTEKEAKDVFNKVEPHARGKTELLKSWGDILLPYSLVKKTSQKIMSSQEDILCLLEFNFAPLSNELLERSFFYTLIKKHKPDIIVDTINTATVVGYAHDPYSLARKVLKNRIRNAQLLLLLSDPVAPLIRFTQSLKHIIDNIGIESYIKVSTTGLGGMGVNLAYTHGDLNEPGMSSGILGKVAAAGVMHQLFWSLSHTPGCNIKVIVPATLVGWQYVGYGDFRSHGATNLYKTQIPPKQKFGKNKQIIPQRARTLNDTIKISYVDSGENNAYSLHEMMAITSLGQMEAVTREEVAEAVLESIFGSTKYDILTVLDSATLTPSYTAAIQRGYIFERMKELEKKAEYPSIATHNLGPTVSKHLFELYVLFQVAENSIEKLLKSSPQKLAYLIKKYFEQDNEIIRYALSLGVPVIDSENNLYILDNAFVPEDKKELKNASAKILEKFIASGWADFRKKTIAGWLNKLRRLEKERARISSNVSIPLARNWQNLTGENLGEILGYVYSMEGGSRKKEL